MSREAIALRLRHATSKFTALVVAALALALAACAPEPEPEPDLLTASEAGALYLDAVCPLNAVWDEADVEIDRLRIQVERGEDGTQAFAASMTRVAEASDEAGRMLAHEDYAWPAAVQPEIDDVRASLQNDAAQALEVAEMSAAEAADYTWQGMDAAAESGARAREALELPEDPVAACTQHAEQRAAEAEPEPAQPEAE